MQISGKDVVVLGRSNIVGMPVAHMLQSMDATVTVCHSRTADIRAHVRRADIVIAAVGKAEMVPASAHTCVPGPRCGTHGPRAPASCVPCVPEAQGSLPLGRTTVRALYAYVPASGVP